MSGFEENEISVNSNGGTELLKRRLATALPEGLTDDFQIICSRTRSLDPNKIRVLWVHDLPEDPELANLRDSYARSQYHKFVFASNWQYTRFQHALGFPYDRKSAVIDNSIIPFPQTVKKLDGNIRLMYTSTPQRGLALLVPVFEKLAEKYSNIHLDVFSSFEIYGWKERDKEFEPLYERIRAHPQMFYHGFKPNDVVRNYLAEAHIHAYPSIWLETSCLAVIEAMSAGLLCVHPNYGALPETSGGLNVTYQGDPDPTTHATAFYHALDHAIGIVQHSDTQKYLQLVKMYADTRFNQTKVAAQWANELYALKHTYSAPESRAVPEEMFVYSS